MLAHFALLKLHILPGVVADMGFQEKAFLFASIKVRIEDEKKAAKQRKGG